MGGVRKNWTGNGGVTTFFFILVAILYLGHTHSYTGRLHTVVRVGHGQGRSQWEGVSPWGIILVMFSLIDLVQSLMPLPPGCFQIMVSLASGIGSIDVEFAQKS